MQVYPFNQTLGEAVESGAAAPALMVARQAMVSPESLPTLPTLATHLDNVMTRLPWWVVAGAASGLTYWWCKKSKSKSD